jgi:ribulose kinase
MGLRDSLELIRGLGLPMTEIRASGGGGRSLLWRQILSDLFQSDVATVSTTEGAAFGAALLAEVGCGVFAGVEKAWDTTIAVAERTTPDAQHVETYEHIYDIYREPVSSGAPGDACPRGVGMSQLGAKRCTLEATPTGPPADSSPRHTSRFGRTHRVAASDYAQ